MWSAQTFETEESVYYCCEAGFASDGARRRIYFSDKEYKDWMPLCAKPNCMHNNENCDSVLEPFAGEIWLYGDGIYYVCVGDFPELWRMELDGSGHQKLMTVVNEAESVSAGGMHSWNCAFQGKYLFLSFFIEDQDGGLLRRYYTVDLSAKALSAEEIAIADGSGPSVWVLCGRGAKLYCSVDSCELYELDLEAGTARHICPLPSSSFDGYGLIEDKLYFCSGFERGSIIYIDVDSGETTEVNNAPAREKLWYTVYHSGIIGSAVADEESGIAPRTEFYGFDGEPVACIEGEAYGRDISISYVVGRYVFGYEYMPFGADYVSDPPEWYIDLEDVGTDRLAWRRWEPEG